MEGDQKVRISKIVYSTIREELKKLGHRVHCGKILGIPMHVSIRVNEPEDDYGYKSIDNEIQISIMFMNGRCGYKGTKIRFVKYIILDTTDIKSPSFDLPKVIAKLAKMITTFKNATTELKRVDVADMTYNRIKPSEAQIAKWKSMASPVPGNTP